ncbi:ClpXP protease specificity-enhancing factor SspB [Rickettsiales endosymbiont of Stachyamoeba lipophora]|uniref:ClpXP protease specificity-enhancing factor SspB n=1 Tax=Rickettsiales endosymbiont of Stachyamoeba lipophora TaxID=2486578 RepID=UPI000F6503E6|nr:ClpXP protease specificity-enhancing factor SspB [Rickettsiales endosymbiont of Stachyamoeba lipophora]AZL16417.1 hypothetical protein EF513_07790 [Rickettsiales endosymbiont of Stachyamoeba lipophora]
MNHNNDINYALIIEKSLYYVVRNVLEIVVNHGLLGQHHFFISFLTNYPGVELSEKLKNKYPHEITIVLQHQYDELIVKEDYFSVVLSFGGLKERIVVPFASLTAFADPSVKFGLQFRHAHLFLHEHDVHHVTSKENKEEKFLNFETKKEVAQKASKQTEIKSDNAKDADNNIKSNVIDFKSFLAKRKKNNES